jgi:hypothetical protein
VSHIYPLCAHHQSRLEKKLIHTRTSLFKKRLLQLPLPTHFRSLFSRLCSLFPRFVKFKKPPPPPLSHKQPQHTTTSHQTTSSDIFVFFKGLPPPMISYNVSHRQRRCIRETKRKLFSFSEMRPALHHSFLSFDNGFLQLLSR